MRKKYGKFYADWRDEHGTRKMKAFPTAPLANKHTRKMKRAAAAKKVQPSERSARISGPGRKRTRAAATTACSRATSKRRSAKSRSAN
jgi:hypothetical protein